MTQYDSGSEQLIPTKGNHLFDIDVTHTMSYSMHVEVKSIDSGFTSVFQCGEHNGIRMPGVWMYSPDGVRLYFHVSFSNVEKAHYNQNANLGSDAVGKTFKLEIQVTQTTYRIFVDGGAIHENLEFPEHHLLENIPCHVGDPWFEPANVVITHLKVASDCFEEKCHKLEGNPAVIWGDPHTTTWSGVKHDFQGMPHEGKDQFYYIRACGGSSRDQLPYQMIGRHFPYRGSTRVSGLDYMAIELFDTNGDQYVAFFNSAIHGFIKGDETDYDGVVKDSDQFIQLTPGDR